MYAVLEVLISGLRYRHLFADYKSLFLEVAMLDYLSIVPDLFFLIYRPQVQGAGFCWILN